MLHYLKGTFEMTATDLSAAMLRQCRRLNPDVPAFVGDMRSLQLSAASLGEGFDAVIVHDAIDYMTTRRDVLRTLATARRHLRPGGVLILAPTYVRETYIDLDAEHDQHHDGSATVTYLSVVHDPDPADDWYDLRLIFVITRRGRTRVIEDRHRCGLFAESAWLDMLAEAGFDATIEPDPTTPRPHRLILGLMTNTRPTSFVRK